MNEKIQKNKYKCPICEKYDNNVPMYEEKDFDIEQNKCILHCDKNEKNNWYEIKETKKIWNMKKLKSFWSLIQRELYIIFENNLDSDNKKIDLINYNQVIFPKHEDNHTYNVYGDNREDMATNFYSFCYGRVQNQYEEEISPEIITIIEDLYIKFDNCIFLDKINFARYNLKKGISFDNCIFHDNVVLKKKNEMRLSFISCDFSECDLNYSHSIFVKKISIINCKNLNNINFKETSFHDKVKIQSCNIKGESNFYNTKFDELADFYRTEFSKVIFERTDFNKIAVFSESEFLKDLNFKYTKFIGKSIFRDTIIKGTLNLRDTIFDDEATFLDITSEKGTIKNIKVANRETARVIKNFYDNANNIIEANRFYALEMKEREKELNMFKNPLEYIVFKFHSISSNHSQNWLFPLLWIINVGLLYIFIESNEVSYAIYIALLYILVAGYMVLQLPSKINTLFLFSMPIALFYYVDIDIDCFAKKISSFFKLSESEKLTTFIFKILIAYLVYQFVIAVRQNTRRK